MTRLAGPVWAAIAVVFIVSAAVALRVGRGDDLGPTPTATAAAASPSPPSPVPTASPASTPLALPSATPVDPCPAPTSMSAERFVREFLERAALGDEAAVRECIAERARGRISASAWARVGGAQVAETATERTWQTAREIVRVRATLQDASVVGWATGEARWFEVYAYAGGWRIEAIASRYSWPSEDEIWSMAQRDLPAGTLILRPQWLPDDFVARRAFYGSSPYSGSQGFYWVVYEGRSRQIHFHRGGGNSAAPKTSERVTARAVEASLSTTDSWPGIQLSWHEDGFTYQIQMSKGERGEILRIAETLIRGMPSSAEQGLIEALRRFAQAPGSTTAAGVPFGSSVALGLGDRVLVTRPSDDLVRADAWSLDMPVHRAYVGPFSALRLLARPGAIRVSVGPHPHCASPPVASPPELVGLRRVSAQPELGENASCLQWWTVDLFVSREGRIVGVTMDLWEP